MNKNFHHSRDVPTKPNTRSTGRGGPRIGPCRYAGRLLLVGHPLILLGLCDFAARLYAGAMSGEVGIMLRMGGAMEYIIASLAILWGGALMLDYMERREKQNGG